MKKPDFMKTEWWGNYGSGILMAGCAVLILVAFMISNVVWNQKLDNAEADALVQQNDLLAQQARDEQTEAIGSRESQVRQAVNGLDPQRKINDDKIASDVFAHALTWSNSEEYAQSRERLIKRYEWLDENSTFLSTFFPPVDRLVIKDSSGAVVYNYLDDGRNISFVSMTSHVLGIENGVYSYIADCLTQSRGVSGGGTASGRIVATYEVNEAGEMTNIAAYVVSN